MIKHACMFLKISIYFLLRLYIQKLHFFFLNDPPTPETYPLPLHDALPISTALIPSEPVTIVLSERGWIRAGKGHDLDPSALQYKSGDAYLHSARGRSNQLAVLIDSTGRTYSLPAHELPSAKGHGEPLTAFLGPPAGASFAGVMMGEPDDLWPLTTDDGYGFIVRLEEMMTRLKAGKRSE